jgi:hypothetical protein
MDMGHRRRTVVFMLIAGLALAIAGCAAGENPSAGSPSPSSSPSGSSPSAPTTPSGSPTNPQPPTTPDPEQPPLPLPPGDGTKRVVVERSGGFAGGMERLLVQPNGAWLYTGARGGKGGGKPQSGQLTADQQRRLQSLLASPELTQESRLKRGPAECNDGFQYSVSTGELTVAWETCSPADSPPTAAAIVSLLGSATPL